MLSCPYVHGNRVWSLAVIKRVGVVKGVVACFVMGVVKGVVKFWSWVWSLHVVKGYGRGKACGHMFCHWCT